MDVRRSESGALMHKIALAVVVLVLATGGAIEAGLIPTFGHDHPAASPTSGVPPATGPGLDLKAPPKAADVLATVTGRPPVSVARLRALVTRAVQLPGLGADVALAVAQLGNPRAHWSAGALAVTPASTMKLLTTTAALATLGPDHRFTTSVVQDAGAGQIVLVGGGDPLLAATTPTVKEAAELYPQPASLQRLAALTAARLASEGVRRVRLAYDASLFTGPAVNPHWPSTYITSDVVSPISALWVNEGREKPGLAERSADPAAAAAAAFRGLLDKAGVKVTGPLTEQGASTRGMSTVAAVSSAPLEEIVQHILEDSDNEGAEVLLRQVAIAAGKPGSSVAGVAAVRAALAHLGIDPSGAVFYDGSGLSRQDSLPVRLLLQVLQTDAAPAHPELRGVVTGLPVAGFSGSLIDRFEEDAEPGLGYVRAKTGTLTGVHALAGIAFTRQGQALAFVAVADQVPVADTLQARADLDQIAASLSACGC